MTPVGGPSTVSGPLDTAPMTGRQILLLTAALLLATLDGFDALSSAFVAPAVSLAWGLDKGVLGLLLASSLVGMAVGALALSPLADVVGRRPLVLCGLVLLTVGSLLSAVAHSVGVLAACRVLTGVGIGAMVAMTALIAAEFSNAQRRVVAVAAVTTIGFPLGGIIGGLASSLLLRTVGWPWVFYLGAIFGALLLAVLFPLLPESPAYLIARRPADTLGKLNRTLAGLGQPPLGAVPAYQRPERSAYRLLFAPGLAGRTLRLAAVNVLVAMPAYYLLNWLPQLVTDAGFAPAQGSSVAALSGFTGLIGGVSFGALAARVAPVRLAAIAMLGMAIGLAAVGLSPPALWALIVAASIFGFAVSGTAGVFYAILASSFPSSARASGVGLVMGAGRIASAIGPALGGQMFKAGMTRAEASLLFAIGPVVAAVLIAGLARARAVPGELVQEAM